MKIKKGDFVVIDYVAREKDSQKIFDLTREDVAKKENVFNAKFSYHAVPICVGEHDVLSGLDDALVDKEVEKEFSVEIPPEKAFGKKNTKLIQLIATSKFLDKKIKPYPGLQLNIDDQIGTVKSVSGGRTLIDFNHPLAGRTVQYTVIPQKILTTTEEKIQAIIDFHVHQGIKTSFNDGIAMIMFSTDKGLEYHVREKILKLIPQVKDVVFQK